MSAEKIIRKHVALIHAYSQMSALQRKIVNVLLYEAMNNRSYENNSELVAVECRTSFSALSKAVNFNSKNTRYLKEAIDGLASLKIEWNLLKDKTPENISFLNMRVLHGAPTFYTDGTFNFSFHKVMLDLIDCPAIYGTIGLDVQARFDSKYGHSLYENSTRFVNLNKNKVVDLETFRRLLGVGEGKTQSMRELNRNVIMPAVEEVNDLANFTVKLEPIKTGKKVTSFEISVNSKNKAVSLDESPAINNNRDLQNELNATFGSMSDKFLVGVFKKHSQEYILEKVAYTKSHAKKEKTGYYPIPYFVSALNNDYKSMKSEHAKEDNAVEKQINNFKNEWQQEMKLLQADLAHWEKMLSSKKVSVDERSIKNIENIINACNEKIKKLNLEQPTEEAM